MAKNAASLTKNEAKNCGANLKYLIDCVFPSGTIPSKRYIPNETIPGLNISLSTLGNARRGAYVSEDTANKIATAFSFYHIGGSVGKITLEDLLMEPDNFQKRFPKDEFKTIKEKEKVTKLPLFTNKVYRGYYMLPNSPYKAYMAYFWFFFDDKGKYSAAMLRGISDFNDVNSPFRNIKFEDINAIKDSFHNCADTYMRKKSTSSIHLYLAEDKNIRCSPNCIQINFHTEGTSIRHSTMYWNIDIIARSNQSSYAGGSALMVDTNEGARGKDICAFKFGLECEETIKEEKPLNNTAPQVIAELMPKTRNGILLIDNADDANWYRFITEKAFRDNTPNAFGSIDPYDFIMKLANLENRYTSKYEELNDLVKQLDGIINPDKKSE